MLAYVCFRGVQCVCVHVLSRFVCRDFVHVETYCKMPYFAAVLPMPKRPANSTCTMFTH